MKFLDLNSDSGKSVTDGKPHVVDFSILSYNVLAQSLVNREWFPYCDSTSLKWKHRRSLVLKQLRELEPDVLCLQEVDQFEKYYRSQLSLMGYGTIYYANEKKRHGCCIAFKSKIFRVGKTRVFEFDDETDYPRSATTGNVGVLAELRSLIDGRGVIIANCHLYWDPCGQYERLRQTLILSNEIKKLKDELNLNAILCGDFNSQPLDLVYYALTHSLPKDNISDMIKDMANSLDSKEASIKKEIEEVQDICDTIDEGLTKIKATKVDVPLGQVDLDVLDEIETVNKRKRSEVSELAHDLREAKLKKVKLSSQLNGFDSLISPQKLYDAILEHPRLISCYSSYAQLDSKYACDNWESDEPKFTNYTDKFKSTLDYIFIPESADDQPDNFFLTRLLSLPPTEALGTGLPDVKHPSDHFPLMASLKWSTSKVYEA